MILANVIVLACTLLSQPAWSHEFVSPRPRVTHALSGRVIAVDTDRGIIMIRERAQTPSLLMPRFIVHADTTIAQNGQRVELNELIGKPVTVEYISMDGQDAVRSITVHDIPTRG